MGVPALAEGFAPVKDKGAFLGLVKDRDLRIGLYDLTINVLPMAITGSALAATSPATGPGKTGFLSRHALGHPRDPYNCQLVEAMESRILRFTVDQGRGQSADFRLR